MPPPLVLDRAQLQPPPVGNALSGKLTPVEFELAFTTAEAHVAA